MPHDGGYLRHMEPITASFGAGNRANDQFQHLHFWLFNVQEVRSL